jgi:hypothetical protein
MFANSPGFRPLLIAFAVCAFDGVASAQTATLTITNNGIVSGAVGVQGPNGNVCNPNAGGGPGSGTCVFTYPVNTPLRIAANSPNPDPGFLHSGTGDAAACATSICNIVLTTDSAITATFDASQGPIAAIQTTLLGDGKGNVTTDNGQCQNFELGYTSCTTYYALGSEVKFVGRSMPGNIFESFSGGVGDTSACGANSTCVFTATTNSSVSATFAALTSVAITPGAQSTPVNTNAFFSARATFTNGMQRFSFNGATPWQGHVSMDVARFSLAAATVNDRLYAIGGVDGTCPLSPCALGPLNTVEVFNPLVTAIAQFDQAWTPRAPMTTPRESLAAAAVNGQIYAVGGHTTGGDAVASMESYDPAANAWTARASMSAPRARMAAAVINNTIYVVGGIASAGGGGATALSTVDAYDAVSDTWTPRAPMLVARNLPAAAAVNGTLYVIGGDGSGSVEAYNPATDTWSMKASMPGGGASHSAVALNGLIYAVGGVPSVTTKVYNPALNSWATLAPTSQLPSGQFALAVLDGRLFAAGGNAGGTAVKTLLANRPPEATWWSNNAAVGQINSGNNGSVNALSIGTATISARLVGIDSGAQSALLTVNSGSSFPILLGIPSDTFGGAFAEVGNPNWGCGTFGQTSSGPWTVQVDYGQGGGFENTSYVANPPVGNCVQAGQFPKGLFFFNHAYNAPGSYLVTVKVTNTTTSASQTGSFHVNVQEPEPEDCVPVIVNIAAVGSVPFNTVHVKVFDRASNQLLVDDELPLGLFDDAALPEGQYRIEFSVQAGYTVTPSSFMVDAVCGQTVHLNATVQAIPPVPPTISLSLSPNAIWPPNNKMITIQATIAASSPNGHATSVQLVSITSNEPAAGDITGAAFNTDDRVFELRAKRNGGGIGRTYTVTYRATDTVTGISTKASATVVVPHDQGK